MLPWDEVIKAGVVGICITIIVFGFKAFTLVMKLWAQSNETVNRNTKSFDKLSAVFEKQVEHEEQFRQEVLTTLTDGVQTAQDTNRKVSELHGTLVLRHEPKGVV